MNLIETTGFICGVLGVYLTMRENIWCFPIGIINVLLSFFLFFSQRLYADAIQQIVYFILISYGWYKWLSGKKDEELKVTRSTGILLMYAFLIACLTSVLSGYLLHRFTNASFPWIDSSATAASFVAQWMIAKKKIENWMIWMIVNIAYIAIYINKHLFLYAVLFLIYFILAIWGYYTWRKQLLLNEKLI